MAQVSAHRDIGIWLFWASTNVRSKYGYIILLQQGELHIVGSFLNIRRIYASDVAVKLLLTCDSEHGRRDRQAAGPLVSGTVTTGGVRSGSGRRVRVRGGKARSNAFEVEAEICANSDCNFNTVSYLSVDMACYCRISRASPEFKSRRGDINILSPPSGVHQPPALCSAPST